MCLSQQLAVVKGKMFYQGLKPTGSSHCHQSQVMGSNFKGWVRSSEMLIQEDHSSVSPKSTRDHCCDPGARTSPHRHSEPTQSDFWLPRPLWGAQRAFPGWDLFLPWSTRSPQPSLGRILHQEPDFLGCPSPGPHVSSREISIPVLLAALTHFCSQTSTVRHCRRPH